MTSAPSDSTSRRCIPGSNESFMSTVDSYTFSATQSKMLDRSTFWCLVSEVCRRLRGEAFDDNPTTTTSDNLPWSVPTAQFPFQASSLPGLSPCSPSSQLLASSLPLSGADPRSVTRLQSASLDWLMDNSHARPNCASVRTNNVPLSGASTCPQGSTTC